VGVTFIHNGVVVSYIPSQSAFLFSHTSQNKQWFNDGSVLVLVMMMVRVSGQDGDTTATTKSLESRML
jgi:hypothetical protein